MRAAIAIALLLIALPVRSIAQEPTWFELYDEATKHIQAGEFEQAEAKLLRAQKAGPASGRSVLRYGSLRPPYFPEYYLGIVYVSTGRPKEALAQFQRARSANIDARNADFRAITTFEGQAKAALGKLASGGSGPTGNPATGGGGTPPPPVKIETGGGSPVPAVDYQKQFAEALTTARTQLSQRSFDAAEQSATSARDLAIKANLVAERPQAEALIREISGSRFAARVETALDRRDAVAARRELTVLTAAVPEYRSDPLRERVEGLEREVRGSTLTRSAMRSFFSGQYEQTLSQLAEAETVSALTPRGHFYRACSLAALAAASANPARDRRLEDAKRSYATAAAGAGQFRDDLPYISPKVKQLLGIK